ncbi:MAG: relaxase domain-containing protein, partial [Rhodospirillales bacterium]|nr:relaxase domain-containing protein [Rhodospirillales bacterium]
MVATLAQAASAAYYLESQRSFRHPNEYYTAGEEPDGVWFNPRGLLGLENGGKVDSGDFHRLYHGFAPDGSTRLTRNAGSEQRSPGVDMTFSADKSVSALWAIADPELRGEIEQAHNDAARVALEETVFRYCAYTRIRDREGRISVLPADISVAMFQHGTSRENDPQLHTHCVIFNAARTHEDGKWRAMHQYPVYSWAKAAGAVYRNALAWNLRERLGIRMEQYGPDGGLTRIEGMPEDLQVFWSKRRKAIVAKAGELGIPSLGNASRMAGVNKITRAGKSHDNDPEVRHRRWHEEAEGFAEREALIASVTGHDVKITREAIRELTARLDDLPAHLARQEAVFRRPDMVEAAANASAGLLGPEALRTAIERLRRNPEIERLEPKKPTAESLAGMAHTEVYSTRHNLRLEQAVKDMTAAMAGDTGRDLPEEAVKEKVKTLLERGYPLSQEQSLAIRHATIRGGRVAVIEGAAGSGKTTTLRPITDLHKEHGYEIVPTAVAWRTAVALGDDCDARAYCVDKLLKLAAKEQVEIGRKTLIVVDEAGMLSTRQAHHILQLSERHGAKVVFAGDTRQQQPVEAGPGLRLIRDVAGSVRVDRIRRQKTDLEDVLVHVHKETPEQARFQAGLTPPQERDAIVAGYEAMERKPVFTPWQVAVSEALRDGEAEKAIEAWHLRGRLHLCHDEEKTLIRLVDDWERHAKVQPGTSTVVLARTKAEGRALSWLMRQRVLGKTPDAKRAVIEVSRDLDGRVTEPLEIAVGDRLRIGATQWEKQLFNGTVVTVEDLEVRRAEDAAVSDTAVSRKARNRQARGAAGRKDSKASEPESLGDESPVHITARTDDGRRVSFRHDEIRDWHDNIRLDYGYAMTIASAQGLTVDRAFLLVDDRPARETVYPAATRHREALDVYVNRSPLAFDIAGHRSEDEADMPVTDSDVRAYLAERWSRSVPKEAALDYVTDGEWRDVREDARHRQRGTGETRQAAAGDRPAANDNTLVRIAEDIRHAVNDWRHGATVDAFAAERGEVMAAWVGLRARARDEGEAVALSPAFRETLDRHGALLKQAASFGARPRTFERLLSERAGIGEGELRELREVHARAGSYLRSAAARTARRARRDPEGENETARRDAERAPEAARADAPAAAETAHPDRPAVQTRQDTGRHTTPVPPAAGEPARSEAPGPDLSQAAYRRLRRDWQAHLDRAESEGVHRFDLDGADALIERIAAFAGRQGLAAEPRGRLEEIVGQYRAHAAARDRVRDHLRDVERHWLRYRTITLRARNLDIPRQEQRSWPIWLERNERLLREGRAILDDRATYGTHIDRIEDGRERLRTAVSRLERFSSAYRTQSRSRD